MCTADQKNTVARPKKRISAVSFKNTPLRVVFSTLFSVFGYPDETLSLMFGILHEDDVEGNIDLKKDSVFIKSFGLFVIVKTITKLNLGHSD